MEFSSVGAESGRQTRGGGLGRSPTDRGRGHLLCAGVAFPAGLRRKNRDAVESTDG